MKQLYEPLACCTSNLISSLAFALGMVLGDGPKAPLDASVLTASAGALLLYVYPHSYLSLDGRAA